MRGLRTRGAVVLVAALVGGLVAPSAGPAQSDDQGTPTADCDETLTPFDDIPADHPAAADVSCMYSLEVVKGISATQFSPDATLTRAQMSVMLARLWNALGNGCPAGAAEPFTDVPAGHWAASEIACLYSLGVVKGTSATRFSPAATLTRAQIAVMAARLWRTHGKACPRATRSFSDVPAGHWAYADIGCLQALGIMGAASGAMFKPDDDATRLHMVMALARLWRANSTATETPPPTGGGGGGVGGGGGGGGGQQPSQPPTGIVPNKAGTPSLTPANSSLVATWSPPVPNRSGITGYTLWYCTSSPSVCTNPSTLSAPGSGSNPSKTIPGLTNGTPYYVRVRAENSFGSGEWSDTATGTPAGKPPNRAGTPSLTPADDSLVAAWSAPAPNDSGITGYKVQWKSGAQDWSDTRQNTATASPNTITGLTNDTLYYVRVRAENDFGSGDWSDTATGTPSALTASAITSTGATLTIADHTGAWHYKETHPSTTATCSDEISAGTSTATLSSLTVNTAYAYTAYSDSGCTAANALGTAYFSTHLTAGNLDEDSSGSGCPLNVNFPCAVGFTTGANPGGYTLASFTASFLISGFPGSGDIVVTLHADNSGVPASAVLATLAGSSPDPDTAGDYTYTCSGPGCALSPSTNYFAQFGGTGKLAYRWDTTHSDSQTTAPTGAGWSIADRVHHKKGSWGTYNDTGVIDIAAVSNPSLTASSVTANSATLTMSHNAAPWWLKRTTPADTACTSKDSATTHSLTNLTPGTSYTYTAYRDSGCTAPALASVTFNTAT